MFFISGCACLYQRMQTSSNNKIKNDIKIKENGLHVEEAYLTNNNQSVIDNDNKVQAGERVCLHLVIRWMDKKKMEQYFLMRSKKLLQVHGANAGRIILQYLASCYGGGADASKCKIYIAVSNTSAGLINITIIF